MALPTRPFTEDEIRRFVAEMRKPYVRPPTFLDLLRPGRPACPWTTLPVASSTLDHFESAGAFSGLPIKPSDSP